MINSEIPKKFRYSDDKERYPVLNQWTKHDSWVLRYYRKFGRFCHKTALLSANSLNYRLLMSLNLPHVLEICDNTMLDLRQDLRWGLYDISLLQPRVDVEGLQITRCVHTFMSNFRCSLCSLPPRNRDDHKNFVETRPCTL